jgi:hypothetical protein
MVVSGQLLSSAALPPLPNEQDAGWATDSAWTLWRRESFATTRNQTADRPARSQVTIPTASCGVAVIPKIVMTCGAVWSSRNFPMFHLT